MADSKVTAMNPATEVASADVIYLVKPNTSPYDHKITIANLFGGIPVPVVLEDKLDFIVWGCHFNYIFGNKDYVT